MSEQAIDGMLLGDAYITVKSVFGFNHSIKQQEYFDHKVQLLESFGIKLRVSKEEIPKKFIQNHWVEAAIKINARSTKTHFWKTLRELWYPKGKKVVPSSLQLTPTALAYWYMDDGSANMRSFHKSNVDGKLYEYECVPYINQIRLYTDGFDEGSQQLLEKKLLELGIRGKHYKRPSGQKFLVIAQRESKERFKEFVQPIMNNVHSMLYKINHPLQSQFERLSEKTPLESGRCDSPTLQEHEL